MSLTEAVFWGSVALALYLFVAYPLAIWLLSSLVRDASPLVVANGDRSTPALSPRVTLLLLGRCGERLLAARLNDVAALAYPSERIEVLVASDDRDVLAASQRVEDSRVHFVSRSGGKPVVPFDWDHLKVCQLNHAIPRAQSQIVVVWDAGTSLAPDAVRNLVRHFDDPGIGLVRGELDDADAFVDQATERLGRRLEKLLRHLEARLGALSSQDKVVFAIRKELFIPLAVRSTAPEFLIGLSVRERGFRVAQDVSAVAIDRTSPTRRMRPGGGLPRSLMDVPPVCVSAALASPRHGWPAVLLWLHQALRRFAPAIFITAVVSNACLAGDRFYLHCLLIQESFYLVTLSTLFLAARRRPDAASHKPTLAPLGRGFRDWFSRERPSAWEKKQAPPTPSEAVP